MRATSLSSLADRLDRTSALYESYSQTDSELAMHGRYWPEL